MTTFPTSRLILAITLTACVVLPLHAGEAPVAPVPSVVAATQVSPPDDFDQMASVLNLQGEQLDKHRALVSQRLEATQVWTQSDKPAQIKALNDLIKASK